jgi:hypothetical protein
MPSQWREESNEQRRITIDAIQLYGHYLDLSHQFHELRGGMSWKTVKGRQYLVRGLDRYGHVRSLGARSRETEAIHRKFVTRKGDLRTRIAAGAAELKRRAKFCVAAGVNRVPTLSANIIRVLDKAGLLGSQLIVLGSHSLYAYEAAAGVQLKEGLLQTEDLDTLLDAGSGLKLGEEARTRGFLGLLRSVDKTFSIIGRRSFRAVNLKGFMVDLLRPPGEVNLPSIGLGKDLVAEPLEGLQWLAAAPKMTQVAIAGNGFPVRMVVPDPRVFALHKIWLSLRPERPPIKRKRDFRQGEAVAQLSLQYLDLSFDDPALSSLPRDLTQSIPGLLARLRGRRASASDLPPGI